MVIVLAFNNNVLSLISQLKCSMNLSVDRAFVSSQISVLIDPTLKVIFPCDPGIPYQSIFPKASVSFVEQIIP